MNVNTSYQLLNQQGMRDLDSWHIKETVQTQYINTMTKKKKDWLELLVENYKVPKETKTKDELLTKKQREIIKNANK